MLSSWTGTQEGLRRDAYDNAPQFFPYESSINDFIDQDKASTQYQQFDDTVRLVCQQGQGCYMAKGDLKLAFKLAPRCFEDLECLRMLFEGEFYIDLTFPFGSSISYVIFEDIATLIHWIFKQQTRKPFLHYLDDYFICFKMLKGCWVAHTGMQVVASDIVLPLTPEKMVPPTQFLTFLGMGIIKHLLGQLACPQALCHTLL